MIHRTRTAIAAALLVCFLASSAFAQTDQPDGPKPPEELITLGAHSTPSTAVTLNGAAYFLATTADEGRELWKTDGTAVGTTIVKDIYPGVISGVTADKLVVLGSYMYFFARGEGLPMQLWRSDGTTEGTVAVGSIGGGSVEELAVVGEKLFFLVRGAGASYEAPTDLWVSDGTAAGTVMLKGFQGQARGLSSAGTRVVLFVSAYYSSGDITGMWSSDGSAAGTVRILKVAVLHAIASVGTSAFFSANASDWGNQSALWKTDGTEAGTLLLKQPLQAIRIVALGGAAYMVVDGNELWTSDGTGAGTLLLKDFELEYKVSGYTCDGSCGAIYALGSAGARLFFVSGAAYYSGRPALWHLWVSDGTTAGTQSLAAVGNYRHNLYSSGPDFNAAIGNTYYFNAPAADHARELWKSDGTVGGTGVVEDIRPETYLSGGLTFGYSSQPMNMANWNGTLLFVANDGLRGAELWKSDGTAAGTELVRNINPEAEISGRVFDAGSNAAIPSAVVELRHRDDVGVMRLVRSFPVSADGTYTIYGLPTLTYFLSTSNSEGYINEVHENRVCQPCPYNSGDGIFIVLPEKRTGVDFALAKGGRISGRITRADNGQPIAGAAVAVATAFGAVPAVTVISDANGDYSTPGGLPAGNWVVYATHLNYSTVIYNGIGCQGGCTAASGGTPVALTAGNTTTGVDFAMKTLGIISGRITDSVSGEPIAAAIWAFRRDREVPAPYSGGGFYAPSGADGRFSLTLPDNAYTVVVEASHYVSEFWGDVACSNCRTHGGTGVTPVPGTTVSTYDVVLKPTGGRIAGSVKMANGVVISTTVNLYDHAGRLVTSTSTSDAFRFAGLASGTYYVTAGAPHAYSSPAYLRALWDGVDGTPCRACNVTSGAPLVISGTNIISNVHLVLDVGGSISGRIYDAATNANLTDSVSVFVYDAVTGARMVELSYQQGTYKTPAVLYPGNYSVVVATDYYSRAYAPSYYGGEYFCPGCNPVGGTPVAVAVNADTTADFAMKKYGRITGTVRTAGGSPVYSATVRAYVNGVSRTSTYTDSSGNFTLTGVVGPVVVTAGSWSSVTVAHDGQECPNCLDAAPLNVPFDGAATANFTLSGTAAKINGKVVDADGLAVSYANVYLYDERGVQYDTDYTYDGVFDFTQLGSGNYYLHVVYNSAGTTYPEKQCAAFCKEQATPITLASGGTTNVTVKLVPPGTISGTITKTGTTTGISGIPLVVWSNTLGRAVAEVVTGANGAYSVAVKSGQYVVYSASGLYFNELYAGGGNAVCSGPCNPASGTPINISSSALTATASFDLTARPRDAKSDFNGDGRSEIMWRHTNGQFAMWELNGRTLVNGAVFNTLGDPDWKVLGFGDFDGDGDDDVFFRHTTGPTAFWIMQGRTIVRAAASATAGADWHMHAIGDFDGDGRDDLLWRNTTTGDVAMWRMNGEQLLDSSIFFRLSDSNWQIQLAADFNGDGRDELVWRHATTGQMAMWDLGLNGRTIVNGAVFANVPDLGWKIVTSGDYNGDGKADLLWRHTDGSIAMWEMSHRTILDGSVMLNVPAAWETERSGDFDKNGRDEVIWRNRNDGSVAMWELDGHRLINGGIFFTVSDAQWKVQPRGGVRPALDSQ